MQQQDRHRTVAALIDGGPGKQFIDLIMEKVGQF